MKRYVKDLETALSYCQAENLPFTITSAECACGETQAVIAKDEQENLTIIVCESCFRQASMIERL